MATLWFMIVAVMVAAYVVLDGFDLGAGVIYLGAARTPDERRTIMRAIGPVWDGNEVWLLAAGGTLYFAFPLLYASSFSGFYLPLDDGALAADAARHRHRIPRAHGESRLARILRRHLLRLQRAADDLLRRGPGQRGSRRSARRRSTISSSRSGPTSASAPNNGILDWYTVLTGVIALVTLTAHGSLYVAVKTEGDLNRRARDRRAVGVATASCF